MWTHTISEAKCCGNERYEWKYKKSNPISYVFTHVYGRWLCFRDLAM
jgi:hypothetical protein